MKFVVTGRAGAVAGQDGGHRHVGAAVSNWPRTAPAGWRTAPARSTTGSPPGRGLPLPVIVADYFHWTHLGDWKFDLGEWPDPAALTAELRDMGVKLMVSVWPSVSPVSENFPRMRDEGLLIGTELGPLAQATWPDKGVAAPVDIAFYDSTNPRAREFVWERVRDNYLRPYGIDVWWLDACEPEIRPGFQANLRYHACPGARGGEHVPEGERPGVLRRDDRDGEPETVSLVRSAWAEASGTGRRFGTRRSPGGWISDLQPLQRPSDKPPGSEPEVARFRCPG